MKINELLQSKGEIDRITTLNLSVITKMTELLNHFENISKKLEGSKCPTIQIVYTYIQFLKKCCLFEENDIQIIKDLKTSLSNNLNDTVIPNLPMYHKIATYLFPPTNKLHQFSNTEKQEIKDFCKEIMTRFEDSPQIEHVDSNATTSTLSESVMMIFGDSLDTVSNATIDQKINDEMSVYDNMIVNMSNNFDVLQWWGNSKNQFPLLYRLSLKILCVPATSAESERTFSDARYLLTEKRSRLDPYLVNDIMFLHSNIEKNELKEIIKSSHNEN